MCKSTIIYDLIEAQMGKPKSRREEDLSNELRNYCKSERKNIPTLRKKFNLLLESINNDNKNYLFNMIDISVINGSKEIQNKFDNRWSLLLSTFLTSPGIADSLAFGSFVR